MELIPVLDIMGKKAVAGKSGRREHYGPLKSVFSNSHDPLEIARNLPGKRLYVADLDGIMKGEPDLKLLAKLSHIKRLIFDMGIRDDADVKEASRVDADMILGTETIEDISVLVHAIEISRGKVVASIDIKEGRVIGKAMTGKPEEVFRRLREAGASRFIFLDISAVGTLSGPKFSYLEGINREGCEVLAGGGIKELSSLEDLGLDGVLVGTALHSGLLEI